MVASAGRLGGFDGSGCPAIGASDATSIGSTGTALGGELFVWLDRPITTAIATAPHQSYGSTANRRLQAHGSENLAETTLGRNSKPNRSIHHSHNRQLSKNRRTRFRVFVVFVRRDAVPRGRIRRTPTGTRPALASRRPAGRLRSGHMPSRTQSRIDLRLIDHRAGR